MKNHQPRLRVVAWVLLNYESFRQASFPARELEPLIRIAEMGKAPCRTVRRLVLGLHRYISLMKVDQRRGRRVKAAGNWFRSCHPAIFRSVIMRPSFAPAA